MVVVLGAHGFVGSAFARLLSRLNVPYRAVGRNDYPEAARDSCDVLINAAGNSIKFLADREPAADFAQSVQLAVSAAHDFSPRLYVLVSSVDVYADLNCRSTTHEGAPLDARRSSLYGFHKQIAEWCVQRHSASWLIVRLAGMVGPGLRKNPVFDILNGRPLRISPESRYQFMSTDDVAEVTWQLVAHGVRNTVFNVCGDGLISPREVADMSRRPITVHPEAEHTAPRIVDVNIERISRIRPMPSTRSTIERFLLEQGVHRGA